MNNYDDNIFDQLASLDRQGFILPPGAAPDAFIAAAGKTLEWAGEIRDRLRTDGRAEVLGEEFTRDQSVPEDILKQCLAPAVSRYMVSPQWVPAFFSKSLLPWYVGGACFYFVDEDNVLRVCFVLSDRFRERRKWLLYSRSEIISHEICHVARSMMEQGTFEESLAYRISESSLRRGLGPMFRGMWEATAILAGSVLILAGSAARVFGAPHGIQHIAYLPLIAVSIFLVLRAAKANSTLSRATGKLKTVYGDKAEAVAFRCTDSELRMISNNENTFQTIQQFTESAEASLRWGVINRQFNASGIKG